MPSGLPRPSECRLCAEPIRFVLMVETGKALPVNPAPSEDGRGNVAAAMLGGRLKGFVITRDRLGGGMYPLRFTAHYATCEEQRPTRPAADQVDPHPSLFD